MFPFDHCITRSKSEDRKVVFLTGFTIYCIHTTYVTELTVLGTPAPLHHCQEEHWDMKFSHQDWSQLEEIYIL